MKKEYKSMESLTDDLYISFNIQSEVLPKSFRSTTENYCKRIKVGTEETETTLFEKTKVDPTKKESAHFFNFEDITALFLYDDFVNYILKRSNDPENAIKQINEILGYAIANKNYLEYLQNVDFNEQMKELNDYQYYAVTHQELKEKKFEMMIEALFLKFFTPIDEEKLRDDMELRNMGGGMDNTPETYAAYLRLQDPKNYYSEKE